MHTFRSLHKSYLEWVGMDISKDNFRGIISQNRRLRVLSSRKHRSSERGSRASSGHPVVHIGDVNLLGSGDRGKQVETETRHPNAGQFLEHRSVGRAVWWVGCRLQHGRVPSCPQRAVLAPKTFSSWEFTPLGLDNS